MAQRSRVVLLACLTLLVTVGLALAGAELLLRANGFEPFRPYGTDDDEPVIFRPDPTLGWIHEPGDHVFPPFSEFGKQVRMRLLPDGSRATAPADADRARPEVLLLGGSLTEGFAINDEETFGWKLQTRFPELAIRNFGHGGYGTYQSLLLLERLLRERATPPRLVIYAFYEGHEIRNVASADWLETLTRFASRHEDVVVPYATIENATLVRQEPARYPLWPLRQYSATVAFAQDLWSELQGRARTLQRREVTQRLIIEMDRVSRTHGTHLLVVFMILEDFDKAVYAQVLNRHGVAWADCARRLTPGFRVPGDGHPNGALNTLWARCLARVIGSRLAASDEPG